MRHCWGTTTMPHTRSATTGTGRETCERETAAWVHWYNTRRPLSLGGITPQQAENQHTTTRKEAASTSLHKTRDLTHPLRGIAPVTWRCTLYVALHPLRRAAPEQKGCNAYRSGAMPTDRVHDPRHKLTCGPARKDVHGPDRLGWARRQRTPDSQPGPAATNPQQLTAPAATHPQQPTAPGNEPQTANRARGRQGLTGLRDDEPSARLAAQTTSGPPSARLAALRGIKPGRVAPAPPSPGAGHTYNEPGRRAHIQRGRGQPRATARPSPGLVKKSSQAIHHEMREGLQRLLRLALR